MKLEESERAEFISQANNLLDDKNIGNVLGNEEGD